MMLPSEASGTSTSNLFPRGNVDLNLPPREEVEIPVEELNMDVYGEQRFPLTLGNPRNLDFNLLPPDGWIICKPSSFLVRFLGFFDMVIAF